MIKISPLMGANPISDTSLQHKLPTRTRAVLKLSLAAKPPEASNATPTYSE